MVMISQTRTPNAHTSLKVENSLLLSTSGASHFNGNREFVVCLNIIILPQVVRSCLKRSKKTFEEYVNFKITIFHTLSGINQYDE